MTSWTKISGCALALSLCAGIAYGEDAPAENTRLTYYKDVLPILQENCQVCHREGGANLGGMVAPMSFTTYESTRPWAKSIAKNVSEGTMPPWHASEQQHGQFRNERTLSDVDRDTLVQWATSGTAPGNPSDGPPTKAWPSEGWSIGTPDLIVKMPEPFFVNDDVVDTYEYFKMTITEEMLPEPRWVKAIEFRPGSSVVHHIIARPLGGIAPGNDPTVYPEGIGSLLRPGTEVTWQMHYHKEPGPDTGAWDQSEAAIVFYPEDAEITHVLRSADLGRFDFRVPPGDPNYSIKTEYTFPEDSRIVSMMPHMHLRGKSAKYETVYPDGSTKVILDVPKYDFNWQTSYLYNEFEFVPKGTKVVLTTTWDNSENNPYNPDPTQAVTFGEPTTAEMSFGFMNYISAAEQEDVDQVIRERAQRSRRGGNRNFDLNSVLDNFDANKDGALQKSEAPEFLQQFFGVIDGDGDGSVTKEELEEASKNFGGGGGRRGGAQRGNNTTD